MGRLGMVEVTIEDLAITIRSLRVTIWGHPLIVGEDVGSKTIPKSQYKAFWYHGNKDAY